MSTKQDLLKVIKKSSKELEKILAIDDNDQLVLKISTRDIKDALKVDPDTKQLTDHFKDEYKVKINEIRQYSMVEAESFKLVFDEKIKPEHKQLYLIAWTRLFANNIVRHNQDHKKLIKKMIKYLIFGLLTILIYTAIQIVAVKNRESEAWLIAAVCFESLLILAWVLLWNFFEILIDDLPASKEKLVDLYLMYKANGEDSKKVLLKKNDNKQEIKSEVKIEINPQSKEPIVVVKKEAK